MPTTRRSDRAGRQDAIRQTTGAIEDSATELANELSTTVQALTEASTTLFTGSVHVFSDLVVGLADTFSRGAGQVSAPASDKPADTGVGGEPVRRVQSAVTGVARTLSRAATEQARVVQDSYGHFSEVYEARSGSTPEGTPNYGAMTVDELQRRARERGIEGRSEMTKDELIKALEAHDHG